MKSLVCVESVTGGDDILDYNKVVILLHQGTGYGAEWEQYYNNGWLGNITGIKYVFPTSSLGNPDGDGRGYVWFQFYGHNHDTCNESAYNLT